MLVKDWLKGATSTLKSAGITSARLDAELLLAHVLERSREWLAAHDSDELSKNQVAAANKLCTQRAEHTPLAYILGSKEFYGRQFIVDESVLIPRPESETIISLLHDILNKDHPCYRDDPCIIWDIGTGSGCLAITSKLEIPEAAVIASDISGDALTVAKKNSQALNADITFIQTDLLPTTDGQSPTVILANLPYVPDELVTSEEITHEPRVALFSGVDGLDHYRSFWHQVAELKLKPQHIIVESLTSQHGTIVKLAKETDFKCIKVRGLIQVFSPTESVPLQA